MFEGRAKQLRKGQIGGVDVVATELVLAAAKGASSTVDTAALAVKEPVDGLKGVVGDNWKPDSTGHDKGDPHGSFTHPIDLVECQGTDDSRYEPSSADFRLENGNEGNWADLTDLLVGGGSSTCSGGGSAHSSDWRGSGNKSMESSGHVERTQSPFAPPTITHPSKPWALRGISWGPT